MIRVQLPTSCPAQDILRLALRAYTAPRHPDRRGATPLTLEPVPLNPRTFATPPSGPTPEKTRRALPTERSSDKITANATFSARRTGQRAA